MNIFGGVTLDPKESKVPVIELPLKKKEKYAEVCFMSDFHVGSSAFSLGQYLEYLYFLKKNPDVKVALLGDLVEMGGLSAFGASEEKVGALQLLDIVKLLEPIKEQIILLLEGNHEERFWRATKGTDSITKSIADALSIKPLLPGPERGQLFILKVKDQAYSVYAIHGAGNSVRTKNKQLSSIFENVHTSLAVHAHIHQIFKDHRTYMSVNEKNGEFYSSIHEQHWLTTGCFCKNLGYSEAKSYPFTKIGAPMVRFYGNKEALEIIDDPRITYDIGVKSVSLESVGLKESDLAKYEEKANFGGTEVYSKKRWKEEDLCNLTK